MVYGYMVMWRKKNIVTPGVLLKRIANAMRKEAASFKTADRPPLRSLCCVGALRVAFLHEQSVTTTERWVRRC